MGTPAAVITSLAKAFEPSEPGGVGGRAEAGDPDGGHGVRDAGDQRRLGADDDQVRADPSARAATDSPDIGSTSWRVATAAMPGLPGRDVHLVDPRVARQREGEGVLTPAGSDHERLHDAPV